MTLILGMSKAEGIYMSTDYRVTDILSGTVLDDASVRFLTVHYPPDVDGPKALVGYTGLASLREAGRLELHRDGVDGVEALVVELVVAR